jgi:hypothetical protein
MLREMDDQRSVDVRGRRIVPNEFTFSLSAKDHAGFQDIEEALHHELAETAREYARAEGYHFLGAVEIVVEVDNDLKAGKFTLQSRMRETAGPGGSGNLVLPSGERIPLTTHPVVMGRMPGCDVVLNDANVSRRHAEIAPSGGGFVVRDLGSTNGTKVNGLRIETERNLNGGDIVSVGNTHLRFEIS